MGLFCRGELPGALLPALPPLAELPAGLHKQLRAFSVETVLSKALNSCSLLASDQALLFSLA